MKRRTGKQWVFLIVLIGFFAGGALAAQDFEVKFKVLAGKELAKRIELPANWDGDFSYVVGFIRNKGKRNALVSLSFWHNRNKFFTSSGYNEIGWVDGNNSAPRFFLIPVGLRNEALPQPSDDFSYSVNVLQIK